MFDSWTSRLRLGSSESVGHPINLDRSRSFFVTSQLSWRHSRLPRIRRNADLYRRDAPRRRLIHHGGGAGGHRLPVPVLDGPVQVLVVGRTAVQDGGVVQIRRGHLDPLLDHIVVVVVEEARTVAAAHQALVVGTPRQQRVVRIVRAAVPLPCRAHRLYGAHVARRQGVGRVGAILPERTVRVHLQAVPGGDGEERGLAAVGAGHVVEVAVREVVHVAGVLVPVSIAHDVDHEGEDARPRDGEAGPRSAAESVVGSVGAAVASVGGAGSDDSRDVHDGRGAGRPCGGSRRDGGRDSGAPSANDGRPGRIVRGRIRRPDGVARKERRGRAAGRVARRRQFSGGRPHVVPDGVRSHLANVVDVSLHLLAHRRRVVDPGHVELGPISLAAVPPPSHGVTLAREGDEPVLVRHGQLAEGGHVVEGVVPVGHSVGEYEVVLLT
mmetsp:Transcript_35316/g.75389  ORF Transcript_35316/g.75389 Transcript_35316/m.75389 type:complete len:438 (+) Transcript_35316:348-1661(+)